MPDKINLNTRLFTLNCNGRLLLIDKPLVMGIINSTPDSFYEGSRFQGTDLILKQAEKMFSDGASMLDIGGQSTRPGSERVSAGEELRRLIAPLKSLKQHFPDAIISVDTYYSVVAEESVGAGANMVNDISGGAFDAAMIETVGKLNVPFICMHNKGTPGTMHKNIHYENVCLEVLDYFIAKIEACKQAGITDVVIDPGFGFSKTITHNFQLLKNLALFKITGRPVMAGISRKSTIYKTLGITPGEALNGTTVLNTISLINGADILRVHDVKEAVEAVKLAEAYRSA